MVAMRSRVIHHSRTLPRPLSNVNPCCRAVGRCVVVTATTNVYFWVSHERECGIFVVHFSLLDVRLSVIVNLKVTESIEFCTFPALCRELNNAKLVISFLPITDVRLWVTSATRSVIKKKKEKKSVCRDFRTNKLQPLYKNKCLSEKPAKVRECCWV